MTETSDHLEPLLHPDEVAKLLNVDVRTLYRWWRAGKGPAYVQVEAGTRRCARSVVREYIAARQTAGVK